MGFVLLPLFFVSGFVGLVYEVLWMRELGRVFGSTASATALTLAVLFLGLALGSYWWGERSRRSVHPLGLYGVLEVGVGGAAAAGYFLFSAYRAAYPGLFRALHELPLLFGAVQCGLAVAALFPAALLMGGTLPVMGQYLVRHAGQLARVGSLLYAANTLGGAAGAFCAGFYLPALFGYRGTYFVAVGASVAVGLLAMLIRAATHGSIAARRTVAGTPAETPPPAAAPAPRANAGVALMSSPAVLWLAALSGFVTLGLEVVWTLMFAQVLHNSVYSFALILFTVLLSLGAGSALAHGLCRTMLPPPLVLSLLLLSAGLAVGITPFLFYAVTDGLAYVAPMAGWTAYIRTVFLTALAVMFVPGVIAGGVFPYLLRAAQGQSLSAGQVLGRLTGVNTVGAVAGSLAVGFFAVPWLGIFGTVRTLASLYFLAVLLVADVLAPRRVLLRVAAAAGILLLASGLDAGRLSILRVEPSGRESVHETWESRHGVVAVTRTGKNLRIRVDNYYSLGGTESRSYEETQADIPLVVQAQARSVFFLGLGTGITAGAALRHPVERVVTAELIPEVVVAARKYFARYLNGLFTDPRSRVVIADGRNYLAGTDERFDVIVSDLFIPWQAGAASLYSREQFEIIRDRLAPGGLFAQWLPLYQLSRDETFIVIRTMLDVFPQVTVWRGDFLPDRSIIALIGQRVPAPLNVDAMVESFRRRRGSDTVPRDRVLGLMGLFYVGNAGALRDRFASYPPNTDDWPIIERDAPVTQREERTGSRAWFTGLPLLAWQEELMQAVPPAQDPYLRALAPDEASLVRAGLSLFKARVYGKAGRQAEAAAAAEEFRALVPIEIAQMFEKQIEEWSTAQGTRKAAPP